MRYRWLVACVLFLSTGVDDAFSSQRTARPNVIIILADDAGVETVGAYGGQ